MARTLWAFKHIFALWRNSQRTQVGYPKTAQPPLHAPHQAHPVDEPPMSRLQDWSGGMVRGSNTSWTPRVAQGERRWVQTSTPSLKNARDAPTPR